ncbi:UNVERIFIED_CONTAM: hypothetical protein K2H54_053620 [Gekko kuhli]
MLQKQRWAKDANTYKGSLSAGLFFKVYYGGVRSFMCYIQLEPNSQSFFAANQLAKKNPHINRLGIASVNAPSAFRAAKARPPHSSCAHSLIPREWCHVHR